jgi:hypothetical protein
MKEGAIVLSLIILVTIVLMFSRSQATRPCDRYVRYFDKTYYNLPRLHVVSDNKVGLNDKTTEIRQPPALPEESDPQASRWAGSQDSQPANDDSNTRRSTNTDIAIEPMRAYPSIKFPKINKIRHSANNMLSKYTKIPRGPARVDHFKELSQDHYIY